MITKSLAAFALSTLLALPAQAQDIQAQLQQAGTVAQQFVALSQNARAYINRTKQPLPADFQHLAQTGIFPQGMVTYGGFRHAAGGKVEFLGVPDTAPPALSQPPGQQTPYGTNFQPIVPQPAQRAPLNVPQTAEVKFDANRFILNFEALPSLSCVAAINSLAIDQATMQRLGVQSVTVNDAPINAPIDTAVVRNLCGIPPAKVGVIFTK